jgi:hypothetical protein
METRIVDRGRFRQIEQGSLAGARLISRVFRHKQRAVGNRTRRIPEGLIGESGGRISAVAAPGRFEGYFCAVAPAIW